VRTRFDVAAGIVEVDSGGGWVALRRPTVGEWCRWQNAHTITGEKLIAAVTAGDASTIDEAAFVCGAGDLNVEIIRTLGGSVQDGPWLHDRAWTADVLVLFRDRPLSPWTDGKATEGEVIRSTLSSDLGGRAVLFAALAPMHPRDVERLELWEAGVLLGRDRVTETQERGPTSGRDASGGDTRSWRRREGQPFLFSDGF
jgi:hypothetical protein